LSITVNWPTLLGALAPDSTYAALAARGLRVAFNGVSGVRLPAKLPSPLVGGDFIGEGAPIPTRRLGLTGITIVPHKMALISHFSDELRRSSVPSIEAVLRQGISYDTAILLDQKLLDNVAASSTRPAGLLNGVTPTAATTGGGLAAIAGDLSALATAIAAPIIDLVYLMNPIDRVRALALAPGLNQLNNIIAAPALAAKTVIALDASDFISGEGDQPRFDISEQAAIHEEDTTPLPLASPGSPNTVAAPMRSLFQTDAISLRFIQRVTFMLGRPGRIAVISSVTW
jgi:Phage capsid family